MFLERCPIDSFYEFHYSNTSITIFRKAYMSTSKITSKFQATIPSDIRKKLHIKAGDLLLFEILDDNTVIIKRARQIDKDYLRALDNTLSEWKTQADEEAYDDLQDI